MQHCIKKKKKKPTKQKRTDSDNRKMCVKNKFIFIESRSGQYSNSISYYTNYVYGDIIQRTVCHNNTIRGSFKIKASKLHLKPNYIIIAKNYLSLQKYAGLLVRDI